MIPLLGIVLSVGLSGILLAAPVFAATRQACPVVAAYAGPPVRSVPDEIWRTMSHRSIDGELPRDLREALSRTLDDIVMRVPAASVAVAVPGVGIWSETRGLATTEPDTRVVANQKFQAASITKTFTAAAVLQLIDEGRLRLDTTVDRWFPDVPNAGVMKIEHLLRHTNGLVSFNVLPSLGERYRSPADAIALGGAEAPQFCPGSNWAYTNTGYLMLGLIVEQIEDAPLHEVFEKRFFAPLALTDTVLRQPRVAVPIVGGHASGRPVIVQDGYATPYAAGGIASTAKDLVKFWQALLAGTVVPESALHTMFSEMPAMSADGQSLYGVGVQMYDVPDGPGLMLGHSGGITGFTSIVAYVAADDILVAALFNDKDVPAEAGLWALVRAVRAVRLAR